MPWELRAMKLLNQNQDVKKQLLSERLCGSYWHSSKYLDYRLDNTNKKE